MTRRAGNMPVIIGPQEITPVSPTSTFNSNCGEKDLRKVSPNSVNYTMWGFEYLMSQLLWV